MYNLSKRVRAAVRAFMYPDECRAEMRSLIREIYEWTHYKDTAWARKAKKYL